jgi:hypothetical protein
MVVNRGVQEARRALAVCPLQHVIGSACVAVENAVLLLVRVTIGDRLRPHAGGKRQIRQRTQAIADEVATCTVERDAC